MLTLTTQNYRWIPPLENGDHLDADEFLRRYEAMPEVKKAELIQGVVYMSSPVRAREHGKPDHMVDGWLWIYCEATPGVEVYANSTVHFGPLDTPQPDIMVCLSSERGGKSSINEKGYVVGAPELVIEIAASSASLDLHEKLETYARFKVPEYLLWLTGEDDIRWLHLEGGAYKPLEADAQGIVRSRVLPGLWLDVNAMRNGQRRAIRAAVERGIRSAEHAAFVK